MRDYDGSAVLEAIRAVQATQAVDETIAVLSGFIESYGFERIFLGQLVNPANVPLREILYVSDWPDELKEHPSAITNIFMEKGPGNRMAANKTIATKVGIANFYYESYEGSHEFIEKVQLILSTTGFAS